jgi:CBS domain-containing protein
VGTYLAAVGRELAGDLARCGLADASPGAGPGHGPDWSELDGFCARRDALDDQAALDRCDARPVAGDPALAGTVRGRLRDGPPRPVLAARLAAATARPAPLGLCQGRLLERDGRTAPDCDVAGRGSEPIVAMARLAAHLVGLEATGTASRLDGLARAGLLPGAVAPNAAAAFAFFERERLMARLVARAGEGETPLRPGGLSARRRQEYRAAFTAVEALRLVLADPAWPGAGGGGAGEVRP